jgi:Icc-related predicted phosphoesterase
MRGSVYVDLMKVHVVSDVHGTADALALVGEGADMLICLGDMLLFLDYADHTQGIFAELYGAENAREYIDLRTARRFDEARQLTAGIAARLSADRGADLRTLTEQAIGRQYAALFGALAEPAYLTYGNVDVPRMWNGHLKPGHHVLDGDRVEVGGITFGLVGAGLISPYRTPNEIPEAEFAAKLDAVGEVDVLCTHIPPAVPELLYDTEARRLETGSVALLEVIRRTQPRYALFGHVHNPLARRARIGRTECVNVGHFRATRTPYVVDL